MATNLRKYKYTGHYNTRPNASSDQSTAKGSGENTPPPADAREMDTAGLKAEIILSLKADIAAVIKSELKNALAEDFDFLRSELKVVKTEIINNTAAKVRDKCDDMEGRMRRCNIRILGVPETPNSSTTTVSKLLTKVLQLEKEPLVDRSHWTLDRGGRVEDLGPLLLNTITTKTVWRCCVVPAPMVRFTDLEKTDYLAKMIIEECYPLVLLLNISWISFSSKMITSGEEIKCSMIES